VSFPRYPKYKDSGVEWVGEVPAHWTVTRLKRIARLLTERTDRCARPVALENIASGSGQFIETEADFSGEGVAFESGDILFGKLRPYLAKVLLADFPGEAVGDFHVMRLERGISGRFVQYELLNPDFISLVDGSTFGARMPRASWGFMGGIELAAPPLPEQTAIAAFLDRETGKIDALVAEQEKLIALLKEKRQAVISHAVTNGLDSAVPMKDSGIEWLGKVPAHSEIRSIKSIATEQHTLFIDGDWIESRNLGDGGIRYITTGNVGAGFYKEHGSGFISQGTFIALNCTEVLPGDVLISRLNPPIGRACVVPKMATRIVTSVDNVIVRPNAGFDRTFLVYRLTGSDYLHEAANLASGTTMQRISRRELGSIRLTLPPYPEQIEIARYLTAAIGKLDVLSIKVARAVTLLKERRSTLISAAVTGQIDVRGSMAA